AAAVLELSPAQRTGLGGLQANPQVFQHIALGADPSSTESELSGDMWHVGLLSPPPVGADASFGGGGFTAGASRSGGAGAAGQGAAAELRFGLENESAKLHIPTLLLWEQQNPGHVRAALRRLPGANESSIDAWLRRWGVAASSGPSRLRERLQNAALADEQQPQQANLRMQWLGGDLNQNYRLDPLELSLAPVLLSADGASTAAPSGLDASQAGSQATLPWQRFLTWHSGQRNERHSGGARIYLNDDNLASLHRRLLQIWPLEWANFVIALRQYGPASGSVAGSGAVTGGDTSALSAADWTPNFSQPSSYSLASVLDLADARIAVPTSGSAGPSTPSGSTVSEKKQMLHNPFSDDMASGRNYLGRLLDEATVEAATILEGRIDITDAPLEVLVGVPGMDEPLAQKIIQQRSSAQLATAPESRQSIAWMVDEGLVELSRLKQLERYLTCRSDVYTVQAVGYRDRLSPVYRCTAVVDARRLPAQIKNRQVWHAWDRGFAIESLAPAEVEINE
ncbi:MAG: hypothetical protein KDA45_10780, partial [Planctomycetales bacterium]|nr:hypothetical protein [Planctomycetales bacterium]